MSEDTPNTDIQTASLLRRDIPVVIAGRTSRQLGQDIAWGLGGYLHPVQIETFSDGEIGIELDASVRQRQVFIIQTMAAPIHDNLMELLLLIDACKRASAAEITVVAPYMVYSRQDRKARPRSPISAKVVANMIERAGADRILTFDLHSGQVQGFYDIPCDNLPAAAVMAPVVQNAMLADNPCIVATDMNGMHRARSFAARMGAEDEIPLAVVDKKKLKAGGTPADAVIGNVRGMHCILVDDMINTAETLITAVDALKAAEASAVSMVVTHGLFYDNAVRRVASAGLQNLWMTDTLPVNEDIKGLRGVKVISVAPLLVNVIKRVVLGDSLEELYS